MNKVFYLIMTIIKIIYDNTNKKNYIVIHYIIIYILFKYLLASI